MTFGTGDDVAVLILDPAPAMALRTDFHAACPVPSRRRECNADLPGRLRLFLVEVADLALHHAWCCSMSSERADSNGPSAALYEHGGTIYGPFSKVEADDLTRQINRTLH
jgi:hypothetical protein